MALTKFCCCCDLRKGCIVFSWLNLMLIALEVTNMASLLQVSAYIFIYNPRSQFSQEVNPYRVNVDQMVAVTFTSNIIIAEQIIKGITIIALIYGLMKKQHGLYQPWLFTVGIECVIWSLLFLVFFIFGCIEPLVVTLLIPIGVITGLLWYFWFSVYAVYQRDQLNKIGVDPEPYEELPLNSNIV